MVEAVSSFRVVSRAQMDRAILIGSSQCFECVKKRAHFYLTLLNSSRSGRTDIQFKFAVLHVLPCLRFSRPKHQLQAVLYFGTYVTDSFSKVLEKLIVPQIVTKLPTRYGTRSFISAFAGARNPSVPSATSPLGGGFTHLA